VRLAQHCATPGGWSGRSGERGARVRAWICKLGESLWTTLKRGRIRLPRFIASSRAWLLEGATVHGFRSSFRDWCGEETNFPREIAEAALAHVTGDKAERAYRRGDALEKRRALMDAWATFLSTIPAKEPK
jgi:integrase